MAFQIRREPSAPVCVVVLHGEVDLAVTDRLRPALESTLESGCANFVLDLSDVTYADSSALGLLIWLNDRVASDGGRIVVAGATREVARILEISGLLTVAPSISDAESAETALAAFTSDATPVQPLWTKATEGPASVVALAGLRSRVAELLEPFGLSEQAAFDMKVAVGEALANAVRHGSPRGEADTVRVEVSALPDRVEVDVIDSGPGFDGRPRGEGDLYAPCGRGVPFMRALTDRVEFRQADGGGTLVRLVKHIRAGGLQR